MAEMHIHWKVERMDEGDVPDPRFAECVLQIEGWIEYDGQPAGLVDAHYVSMIVGIPATSAASGSTPKPVKAKRTKTERCILIASDWGEPKPIQSQADGEKS